MTIEDIKPGMLFLMISQSARFNGLYYIKSVNNYSLKTNIYWFDLDYPHLDVETNRTIDFKPSFSKEISNSNLTKIFSLLFKIQRVRYIKR